MPSAASKAGVMYEIANGEEIPNLGETLMAVVTDDGAWRGLQAQVADVSKMLQSVRSLVKAGHTVVFGGTIITSTTRFRENALGSETMV